MEYADQEYQQEEQYPMSPQLGLLNQASEGSLRFQLEINTQIEMLEHDLKGEVLQIDDNGIPSWNIPIGQISQINDKGAKSLLGFLKMSMSKVFVLTDLDEEVIGSMSYKFGENVKGNILQNWDIYSIKDDTAASLILHTLSDAYYANLRRAHRGNYLKFLTRTHSIQETQHSNINQRPQQQEQQQSNPLGFLFKRKR